MSAAVLAAGGASTVQALTSGDKLKIGIITLNYSTPSVTAITDAAMKECSVRKWICELASGNQDIVATSNAGVNFVNRQFDVVLNSVTDNNQLATVIKAANQAGVPYVSMFSGNAPGIAADIGVSGAVQGALIGDEIRAAIGLKGKVVVINWNVLPILRERERAVRATMADDKNIEIIALEVKVPGYVEDAYTQLTAELRKNQDIKAVVVGWNELAPGAIRAIKSAGLTDKVKLYGFDTTPDAIELLRKGPPFTMMTGFGFAETGRAAMDVVADIVDGRPPKFTGLMQRSCLWTKDNLPAPGERIDYAKCTPFTAEIFHQ